MEDKIKHFICIQCPRGCHLTVDTSAYDPKDGDLTKIVVSGQSCARGLKYGRSESVHPIRTVTSSVIVKGGEFPVVCVKTKDGIPKELIFKWLEELKKGELKAPVHIGDVVIANVLGTGVDVVATKNIKEA